MLNRKLNMKSILQSYQFSSNIKKNKQKPFAERESLMKIMENLWELKIQSMLSRNKMRD
jgi:hypothetical protein